MAKVDIYAPGWTEVVFAGRNKAYGAYALRMENSKTTSKALIIGGLFFILSISGSTIYKAIAGLVPDLRDTLTDTEVVLAAPPPIDKKVLPPPPEPPKAAVPEIKFPPPVVVPAEEVEDEMPPTLAELKFADPGSRDITGDPNSADIKIDVKEVVRVIEIVDDTPVEPERVQILPQFQGGASGWAQFMQGYNYPAMARENNVAGTVYVSFVVEKDGSLTDIKVLREPGFGTGEEAIRLLKTSPKWSPGVQNGVRVRVAYTQAIKLALN